MDAPRQFYVFSQYSTMYGYLIPIIIFLVIAIVLIVLAYKVLSSIFFAVVGIIAVVWFVHYIKDK